MQTNVKFYHQKKRINRKPFESDFYLYKEFNKINVLQSDTYKSLLNDYFYNDLLFFIYYDGSINPETKEQEQANKSIIQFYKTSKEKIECLKNHPLEFLLIAYNHCKTKIGYKTPYKFNEIKDNVFEW